VRSFFRCPFQHAGVALTTDDKLSIETLRLVFPNAYGLKYRANGGYNYISYVNLAVF